MKYAYLALVLALAGCGGGSSHAETPAGGTYPIHLVRHVAVGTRWTEVAHFLATQEQTVHEDGAAPQPTRTSTTIDLRGEYEVLAQDAEGEASRIRLTVEQFTVDTGTGVQSPALPHVVVIERARPGSVAGEQGEAIEPAVAATLALLAPMNMPPANMDAVYGTSTPQPVGGSWSIDSAAAAGALGALDMTVDPANVSGTTTLVSAANDVLSMRTEIHADHVGVPNLPPGAVEQHATVQAVQEDALPLDESLPPPSDAAHATVDIEVAMTTPTGTNALVNVLIHQEVTHQRTVH